MSLDTDGEDSQRIIRRLKVWCVAQHSFFQEEGGGRIVVDSASH